MKKRKKVSTRNLFLVLLALFILIPVLLLVVKYLTQKSFDAAAAGPAQIKYTALGDSVTWQSTGYVSKYSNYIPADLHTTISTTNLGTPFVPSWGLLSQLQTDQNFRTSVASANLITIFIGLNDYQGAHNSYLDPNGNPLFCPPPQETCVQTVVNNFKNNWNEIIAEIKSLNPNSNLAIRTLTIYNPYVNVDKAAGNFNYFKQYLDQMNAHIVSTSNTNGILVADINKAFNGPNGDLDATEQGFFTAPDALHPNDSGHTAIANTLRGLGYPELDNDKDGFTNVTETAIGTNPNLACGVDAWPPDYDNSGKVESGDFQILLANWNKLVSSNPGSLRYDLNLSGKIDSGDFYIILSLWNKRCTAS